MQIQLSVTVHPQKFWGDGLCGEMTVWRINSCLKMLRLIFGVKPTVMENNIFLMMVWAFVLRATF